MRADIVAAALAAEASFAAAPAPRAGAVDSAPARSLALRVLTLRRRTALSATGSAGGGTGAGCLPFLRAETSTTRGFSTGRETGGCAALPLRAFRVPAASRIGRR